MRKTRVVITLLLSILALGIMDAQVVKKDEKTGKYGIYDEKTGKAIIKPQMDEIGTPIILFDITADGSKTEKARFYPCKKEGVWGIVDAKGKYTANGYDEIGKPVSLNIGSGQLQSVDFIPVAKQGKWGWISSMEGKLIYKPLLIEKGEFQGYKRKAGNGTEYYGVALVKDVEGYFEIDHTGKPQENFKWTKEINGEDADGVKFTVRFLTDGRTQTISDNAKLVGSVQTDGSILLRGNKNQRYSYENIYAYISPTGKTYNTSKVDNKYLLTAADGKKGLMDEKGNILFQPEQDKIMIVPNYYILKKGEEIRAYDSRLEETKNLKPLGYGFYELGSVLITPKEECKGMLLRSPWVGTDCLTISAQNNGWWGVQTYGSDGELISNIEGVMITGPVKEGSDV